MMRPGVPMTICAPCWRRGTGARRLPAIDRQRVDGRALKNASLCTSSKLHRQLAVGQKDEHLHRRNCGRSFRWRNGERGGLARAVCDWPRRRVRPSGREWPRPGSERAFRSELANGLEQCVGQASSENSLVSCSVFATGQYNRYSRLMRANSGPCFRRQSLPSGYSRQGRCAAPSVKILDCGGSCRGEVQRRLERSGDTAFECGQSFQNGVALRFRRSPNKLIAVASRSHFVSFSRPPDL